MHPKIPEEPEELNIETMCEVADEMNGQSNKCALSALCIFISMVRKRNFVNSVNTT